MLKYLRLLPLFMCTLSFGQSEIKDSAILITSVRASYSPLFPGGDMAKRFGWSSSMGLGVDVKTKKSILFGIHGAYFFGNKVKEDVLTILRNDEGNIIDQNGAYAKVLLYERGFTVNLNAGYLFRVLSPNPNSGIMVMAGGGFIQHKIRIEHNINKVPALEGDYKKGYDRLTNGLCINEFVGYQFLSNNRLLNFFAGFEFYQGFTKSRRDWNIDEVRKDDSKRVDLLTGFRVGWILPLYRRAPKDFYMY